MQRYLLFLVFFAAQFWNAVEPRAASAVEGPSHAISMHGAPALDPGFAAYPYVRPDAPKGGRLNLGALGSFDNLNPLIVRGDPVQGIREFVIESLMARSQDEPFTLYGLIAEAIEVTPARDVVTFHLNPKARFSDGQPLTAKDVIFSLEVLREKGRPNFRAYYRKVAKAEILDGNKVRFTLDEGDRELPLILGLMPILPSHIFSRETFDQTTLTPIVGSGPYRISRVDPGRSITYERNPDYWGRDLPVNRGRFNFDEIRFEYFRDITSLFETFKSGGIDVRNEDDPSRWAQAFDFPAVREGRVVKEAMPIGLPAGMTGLVFNMRRDLFKDQRVRQALILLFDFEWANKSLFHGLFKRTESFFERSLLSSTGKPADTFEQTLLAPYLGSLKPEIVEGTYRLPVSEGTGHNRENAREAYSLLSAAGYELVSGRLVEKTTGKPFEFEVLAGAASQDRLLAAYRSDLERLGIRMRIRLVDSAQYQARLKDYDFDMIQFTWPASLSPGNEQLFRWSAKMASQPGSYNYAGVANPAVDAAIAAMLAANGREDFISSVRALDRVLLSGDYVIPLFHPPTQWVAYWTHLAHPERIPLFGLTLDTWWVEHPK